MKPAVVLKLYGDPETSQAIADGIIRIETVSAEEMEVVHKELNRLKTERELRMRCDNKRYNAMVEAMNVKYPVRRTNPVLGKLMIILLLPYLLVVALKQKIIKERWAR